jgi:hypothetical protein
MLAKTQYAILGVAQTESHDGLRRVFRQLVKRYHPDRAGPHAMLAFQQIINAYRLLEREEWRKHYDKGIDDVARNQAATAPVPVLVDDVTSEDSAALRIVPTIELKVLSLVALNSLADRMRELLCRTMQAGESEWEPLDLTAILPAADAARGGLATLVLPAWYPCAECRGSGRVEGLPCRTCDGTSFQLDEARIYIRIPPLSSSYLRMELPLPHLGVLGKYLRLHLRVV